MSINEENCSNPFAECLIRWRWLAFAMAAALLLLAVWRAKPLEFDQSITGMFAPHDPLLAPMDRLQRTFGAGEIVLAAYVDDGVLSGGMRSESLKRLGRVSEQLAAVPGVVEVVDLRTPIGDVIVTNTVLARRFSELFVGYTHSDDGQVVALSCRLLPRDEAPIARDETIAKLREIIGAQPHGILAGEPVMVSEGFRLLEADGHSLAITSSLLLLLTIAVCFRNLRWMLIPLAVVQWTRVMTQAVLVAGGFRLSMVSSMLTAVVTVVGVATVMHVIVRMQAYQRDGLTPLDALRQTISVLATPIAWACVTDAVGFAALMVADVGPVRDFGLMMATGALLVIVAVATIVPALAVCWARPGVPRRASGERSIARLLTAGGDLVQRHPVSVAGCLLVATGLLSLGCLRLQVETDFTRNFRPGTPLVQSYELVETRLGGAGVWDILLPAPSRLDWDYLHRVLKLEQRLRDEAAGLTKVLSLADVVEAGRLRQAAGTGGKPPAANSIIPKQLTALADAMLLHTELLYMEKRMPKFYRSLYEIDPQTEGQHYLRIMLRARERQPAADKQELIAAVRRISHEEFPEAEVTGYFVLLSELVDSILRDGWKAFGVATAGIFVMLWLALRSLRLAAIALVPNAVPVLIVSGLLGWLNVPINMGAAMIAAVSIGLSVDATIHYLASYRRARRNGADNQEAISYASGTAGLALVFSTLALIVGFAALAQSEFLPTVYFGVLVSITMLGALLGNLLVLPLMLRWVFGKSSY